MSGDRNGNARPRRYLDALMTLEAKTVRRLWISLSFQPIASVQVNIASDQFVGRLGGQRSVLSRHQIIVILVVILAISAK